MASNGIYPVPTCCGHTMSQDFDTLSFYCFVCGKEIARDQIIEKEEIYKERERYRQAAMAQAQSQLQMNAQQESINSLGCANFENLNKAFADKAREIGALFDKPKTEYEKLKDEVAEWLEGALD